MNSTSKPTRTEVFIATLVLHSCLPSPDLNSVRKAARETDSRFAVAHVVVRSVTLSDGPLPVQYSGLIDNVGPAQECQLPDS